MIKLFLKRHIPGWIKKERKKWWKHYRCLPWNNGQINCAVCIQWNIFVQSLSRVWLFVIPWTASHQASLSFTNSRSLLNLMSIESVMPSNHLILCRPLLLLPSIFTSIRLFPVSQFFTPDGQRIAASASASVLAMNIQGWSPLGWTNWISLQSKGLSRTSNTTVQKHQYFG